MTFTYNCYWQLLLAIGLLFTLGRPLARRLLHKAPSTYMYTYIQTEWNCCVKFCAEYVLSNHF